MSKVYQGLDISKHQADQAKATNLINWQKAKRAGVAFAWVKFTEGETYQDPAALNHVKAVNEAGSVAGGEIYLGGYHFFRCRRDPKKQAQNFYETHNKAAALDPRGLLRLPPMLDLEPLYQIKQGVRIDVDGIGKLEKGEYAHLAFECAAEVGRLFGVAPLAYMYPAFAAEQQLGLTLSQCPLWMAHYGVKKPTIAKGWQRVTLWQKSGSGRVDGAPTEVDLDELYPDAFAAAYPHLASLLPV